MLSSRLCVLLFLVNGAFAVKQKLEISNLQTLRVAINEDIQNETLRTGLIGALNEDFFEGVGAILQKALPDHTCLSKIIIDVPDWWPCGAGVACDNLPPACDFDIIIAPQHPRYGHGPYTKHTGECGDMGEYIHLTPEYVADPELYKRWGPRDKTLVHELLHYWFGVFDEYPSSPRWPATYQDKDGKYRPSTCSEDIPYTDTCKKDPNSCKLTNPRGEGYGSLLGPYYLESVTHVCDSSDDTKTKHNSAAQTPHNFYCDRRSVLDVISRNKVFTKKDGCEKLSDLKVVFSKPRREILLLLQKPAKSTNNSNNDHDNNNENSNNNNGNINNDNGNSNKNNGTSNNDNGNSNNDNGNSNNNNGTSNNGNGNSNNNNGNSKNDNGNSNNNNDENDMLRENLWGSVMGTIQDWLENLNRTGSNYKIAIAFSDTATCSLGLTGILDNQGIESILEVLESEWYVRDDKEMTTAEPPLGTTESNSGESVSFESRIKRGTPTTRCDGVTCALLESPCDINPATELLIVAEGSIQPKVKSNKEAIEDKLKGHIVNAILINPTGSTNLVNGRVWKIKKMSDAVNLKQAFTLDNKCKQSPVVIPDVIQVSKRKLKNKDNKPLEGNIQVDKTMESGMRVTLEHEYATSQVELNLTSPAGQVYTLTNFTNDISLYYQMTLTWPVEVGRWTYKASISNDDDTMTITAEIVNITADSKPIVISTSLSTDVLDFQGGLDEFCIIRANVLQGLDPVLGVSVTAIVTFANDTSVSLQLKDNGLGADSLSDDGVYSGYLTSFSNGSITITAFAKGEMGKAQVLTINPSATKAFDLQPSIVEEVTEAIEDDFERTGDDQIVEVENYDETYNLPPAKIKDLDANIDVNKNVTLNMTSTGGDLDQGKVQTLEVIVSPTIDLEANGTQVDVGEKSNITEAGEPYTVTFPLTLIQEAVDGNTAYVGVKVTDDAEQPTFSNTALLSLITVSEVIISPDDNTTLLPNTPLSPNTPKTGQSQNVKSLDRNIIIGCSIAGVIVIALFIVVLFVCWKRMKRKRRTDEEKGETSTMEMSPTTEKHEEKQEPKRKISNVTIARLSEISPGFTQCGAVHTPLRQSDPVSIHPETCDDITTENLHDTESNNEETQNATANEEQGETYEVIPGDLKNEEPESPNIVPSSPIVPNAVCSADIHYNENNDTMDGDTYAELPDDKVQDILTPSPHHHIPPPPPLPEWLLNTNTQNVSLGIPSGDLASQLANQRDKLIQRVAHIVPGSPEADIHDQLNEDIKNKIKNRPQRSRPISEIIKKEKERKAQANRQPSLHGGVKSKVQGFSIGKGNLGSIDEYKIDETYQTIDEIRQYNPHTQTSPIDDEIYDDACSNQTNVPEEIKRNIMNRPPRNYDRTISQIINDRKKQERVKSSGSSFSQGGVRSKAQRFDKGAMKAINESKILKTDDTYSAIDEMTLAHRSNSNNDDDIYDDTISAPQPSNGLIRPASKIYEDAESFQNRPNRDSNVTVYEATPRASRMDNSVCQNGNTKFQFSQEDILRAFKDNEQNSELNVYNNDEVSSAMNPNINTIGAVGGDPQHDSLTGSSPYLAPVLQTPPMREQRPSQTTRQPEYISSMFGEEGITESTENDVVVQHMGKGEQLIHFGFAPTGKFVGRQPVSPDWRVGEDVKEHDKHGKRKKKDKKEKDKKHKKK